MTRRTLLSARIRRGNAAREFLCERHGLCTEFFYNACIHAPCMDGKLDLEDLLKRASSESSRWFTAFVRHFCLTDLQLLASRLRSLNERSAAAASNFTSICWIREFRQCVEQYDARDLQSVLETLEDRLITYIVER